jgi:uncharacterized protein
MFAAICHDHVDGRAKANRLAALKPHLAYIESVMHKIAVAGPLRDSQGEIIGSLLIYRVSTLAEAEGLLHADPYHAADIWAHVSVQPFTAVAGEWVGGKTW